MLEQQKADAGSASAFIGSCSSVMGSIGMGDCLLPWHNLVVIIGLLYARPACSAAWHGCCCSADPFLRTSKLPDRLFSASIHLEKRTRRQPAMPPRSLALGRQ
jgi:hypothetical protein